MIGRGRTFYLNLRTPRTECGALFAGALPPEEGVNHATQYTGRRSGQGPVVVLIRLRRYARFRRNVQESANAANLPSLVALANV
jgi:hypothetical protein